MAKKRIDDGFVEPMVEEPRDHLFLTEVAAEGADPVASYVRNRPYEATLLTLAGGMLLGLLIGLRR